MAKKGKDKLNWCTVRLGEDMNWWVEKTSDPINWDVVDGLSILDPRQIGHVIDLSDCLVDYGFTPALIDKAFYKFHIEKDLGKGKVRVERVPDSLLDPGEPLFALPDIVDEERGPYADLVNALTKFRVKMLNDVIDLEEHLTIEELEDELREQQNEEYMEGRAVHLFNELVSILEFVPEGFELEDEDEEVVGSAGSSSLDEEFPDLDDEGEKLEKDETMRWGDEEEEEADSEEFSGEAPELGPKKAKSVISKPKKKAPASKKPATKKKAIPKASKKKAPAKKKAPVKKTAKKKSKK